MVSRGRPEQLKLAVGVLRALASGKHDVSYIVGCDDDDYETQTMCNTLKVTPSVGPRPRGVSSLQNRVIRGVDADIYVPFPDDGIALAQNWDNLIAVVMAEKHLMIGWNDVLTRGELTYPVLSRAWVDAVDKPFGSELFSFWFGDTWMHEIYRFVTNQECMIINNLMVGGKSENTQNMRDLDFWWGLFNATRGARLKEAYGIHNRLYGVNTDFDTFVRNRMKWVMMGEARDAHFRPNIPTLEKNMGTGAPPTERYQKSMAEAKSYLSNCSLEIWTPPPFLISHLKERHNVGK